jgi:hypothetical protein
LGYSHAGALDYSVMLIDATWLEFAAHLIESKNEIGSPRHDIACCLRKLAATPAALKELNRYRQRAPQAVRALNIAVHYLACKELLGKSDAALLAVAQVWKGKESTVKDANRKFGKQAQSELRSLVKLSMVEKFKTKEDVLSALVADMADRVNLDWMIPRKKPRKNRRTRKRA